MNSFALFSFPASGKHQLVAENTGAASDHFLFHPFQGHLHAKVKIAADFSKDFDSDQIPELNTLLEACLKQSPNSGTQNKSEYLDMIENALGQIRSGVLEKIVLSRTIHTDRLETEGMVELYLALRKAHPEAFVYLIAHADAGVWIGATPEILLSKSGPTYTTMSLAGTKPTHDDSEWGEKEKEEQAIVTRYITDQIKGIGATDVKIDGPQNKIAGEVKHLLSVITFKYAHDPEALFRQLHPTPAVAGFPKDKSLQLIPELESYDRGYYTGFCGMVSEESTQLFVNLRCAQLFIDKSQVYVGGGITRDSSPEDEWEETELKSTTIIKAIKKI